MTMRLSYIYHDHAPIHATDADDVDDKLSIVNQITLFLTYLGALMIKFQQGFKATGVSEEGYSADFVAVMLIGSALVVALGFGCTVVHGIVSVCFGKQTEQNADTLQDKAADRQTEQTNKEQTNKLEGEGEDKTGGTNEAAALSAKKLKLVV
jgi:hypothetical protein